MRLWPVALALALGCGPSQRVTPGPKPLAESPAVERKIRAESPEVTVRGEDGEVAYVVRAETSKMTVGEEGAASGALSGVSGEIRKGGQTASKFKATSGEVDQKARTLTLQGEVTVTDEARGIVLKAQRVFYAEAKGRIEASGQVTVSSGSALLGPVDALWASPGLERVATPDLYK
ncbi:MAG: hypothetical protein KF884_08945 [Fimbriimonadaceae bacterium]|nr:hypothetical protein [Fimbriimonadaceae bacterium]QYK57676.1 MAG: hypothetical protein KF884_08945 [Fimbriimonadaceae bacterium]